MAQERNRARASELRKRAEITLAEAPQAIRTMVPADTQKLIHELNVHQIELEMQNAELRRVQLELQEARDKYLNLYDFAPTGYFTLDHNSLIVDVNLAGSELLGSEKHRLIGTQFTSSISPDSQDAFYFHYREVLKTGIKGNCELKMLKADGTPFHAQLISMAVPEKDGNINQCRTAVIDISERKRIEKRLWDSMSNFHKVINDNPDSIIITNRQGIVRYINPAAESLFGRKSEDFNGKQFGFPITSSEITEVDIARQAGEIVVAEMRVAETVWYGEIAYLISLHDISERKQAHQAQERLSQQLQAKVSELETFSYGIAHDLRSPLVSIEGFSRLLRDDMLNHDAERVQEDIRLLESGVKRMQGFLNSTLEYSRSGQMIKRTRDVSFSEIVTEVITEFNGQISAIGATVATAKTFPRVYVDRARIAEVLTNLIQNSIKYRDKTIPLKIEIGYRLSEGEVVFFVCDNGTGIEESETEKVFDLFYRGSTEGEGSGTGLAIVKRIIEAHGGKIWVQQGQAGKGTTMCFTLAQHNGINKGDNNGKD